MLKQHRSYYMQPLTCREFYLDCLSAIRAPSRYSTRLTGSACTEGEHHA